MDKKYFADRHPLPVLIFLTTLVYAGLYSRFLFGNAVFMYSDIGSDSLSSSYPTLMMLSHLYDEGALGTYSLTNGLGGSTALFFMQYLNPLKFLLIVFGEAWFPVVILIHQYLLHLLTALTGYAFFSRLFRDRTAGVFAAIIWAYSGYMVGWGQNYTYGVCILTFTLAMCVLQFFLDKPTRRRFFLLALTFAFFILVNYYFFYMSGIFIAFYVLFETIVRGRHVENENRPRHLNAFVMLIRREFSVLLAAICAIGLSAAPLTQILTQFLGSSRTGEVSGTDWRGLVNHFGIRTILSSLSRFFSPNLLGAGSHYGGTVDYYSIAFLFTSILLVFALIYLLTVPKTILPVVLFAAVSAGMLFFPAAGYLLTFNVSAQRYAYLIAFVGVILIEAFLHSVLREDHPRRLVFSAVAGFAVVVIAGVGFYILFKHYQMAAAPVYFALMAVSALIFMLIFLLLGRGGRKRALAAVCLLAVCLEMVASGWGTFYDRDYLTVDDYYHAHFNDGTRAAVDYISANDGSLYRVTTSDIFNYANEGMVDNFNATTAYSNQLAASMVTLGRTAGIQQFSPNFFLDSYDDYYLLTLLAGKYLVTDEPSSTSFSYDGAAYKKIYDSGTAAVFENANPLPFGYVYNTRLDNEEFEGLSTFDRQRALTQGYLLTDGDPAEVTTKTAAYEPPATVLSLTDHILEANDLTYEVLPDGRLSVTPTGYDPFLVFDISSLHSIGEDALQYFSFTLDPATIHGRQNYETFVTCSANPGQLMETLFFVGDSVPRAALLMPDGALTLRLDLTYTGEVIFNEITYSQIDDPAADFAALAGSGVSDISYSYNDYKATVTGASSGSLLCVPFLYERGWLASVNGETVEPVNVNGGLIGIPLPAGDSAVTLTYTPPYLIFGIVVSAVFLLILLVVCFMPRQKK